MVHAFLPLRRPTAVIAGTLLSLGLFAATPAKALDDGQQTIFDSFVDFIKMGLGSDEDEKPLIEYRERAPLVLPPKAELPRPLPPVAQRSQAWPLDQDVARQRQAAAERAKPRGNDYSKDPATVRELKEFRNGQTPSKIPNYQAGACSDLDRLCNPNEFWTTLKSGRPVDDTSKDLVAGYEPPRAHLTDPPKGYRAPSKNIKATFDAPDTSYQDNLASGAAQVRAEAQRRQRAE